MHAIIISYQIARNHTGSQVNKYKQTTIKTLY